LRALIIFVLGALIGAVAFHVYYVRLTPQAQCGWDHPFDDGAKRACVLARQPGYTAKARAALDDLVGEVSH
jgi:hypothetical protein